MSLRCYIKDFGRARFAVCEDEIAKGILMTATEPVAQDEPDPSVWARLGALLAKAGEVVEAQ